MSAQARLTSHLLATARYIGVLNLVVFALSFRLDSGFFCLQILLCVLAHQHITTEELDKALDVLKLKMPQGDRNIAERVQGALRLWKYVLYGAGIQLLLLFLAG